MPTNWSQLTHHESTLQRDFEARTTRLRLPALTWIFRDNPQGTPPCAPPPAFDDGCSISATATNATMTTLPPG
jgi:hypothetical protein